MSTLDSSALNVIDLDDAKIITWDGDEVTSITKAVLEDYGVWAVSKDTKYEGFATVIYLGNKLGDSADATVYVNDTAVKFDSTLAATVNGTNGADAIVTAKAATDATVTIAGDKVFGESKQATVTVVSEDGTATNVYTVTLGVEAAKDATVKYVLKANVNGVEETYTGTWTGPAGTYSGQELENVRGVHFPTFKVAAGNYTLVTDNSTVTVAAGETVTLTYVVNVH